MAKITFYTQAYNAEKYIGKCIESVLNQTFTDFEYFLVDNGSTDKTRDIIAEYAKKDSRIIAIYFEENCRDIFADFIKEKAKGEYFASLDSDDWYEPTFAEKLIKTSLETGADLISCASTFVSEKTNKILQIKRIYDQPIIINSKDFSATFPMAYTHYGALWGRLYRTDIFRHNNISGNKDVRYGADTVMVLDYQQCCKRVAFHPEPLHNYLIRKSGSISSEFNNKALENNENLYRAFYLYLKKINGLTNVNIVFIAFVYLNLITNKDINPLIDKRCTYEEKLEILYKTLFSEITNKCWNSLKLADSTIKKSMQTENALAKYSEIFLGYILDSYNRKNNDKFYKMICFLFPMVKEIFDENDVSFLLGHRGFLNSFINFNLNTFILKLFSELNDPIYSENIWGGLKKIMKQHQLLNWVTNMSFAKQYSDILIQVYNLQLAEALRKILEVLTQKDRIIFEEDLLFLYLNIAAFTKNAPVFVLAKKLQTQFFIKEKRFTEAATALKDLQEMCPSDNEVLQLEKWLEEENG